MKMHVSKAYRDTEHVGFKKTIAKRSWFLIYGTTAACEGKAIAIATACYAKWQLLKLAGHTEFTDSDFADAKRIALGLREVAEDISSSTLVTSHEGAATTTTAAVGGGTTTLASTPRRWLHAALDEVVSWVMKQLKADGSNADHVMNRRDRILRAREAIQDLPLDMFRRKELDTWLQELPGLKSKRTGKPLEPASVRNLAGAVRMSLKKVAAWEYWTPPTL